MIWKLFESSLKKLADYLFKKLLGKYVVMNSNDGKVQVDFPSNYQIDYKNINLNTDRINESILKSLENNKSSASASSPSVILPFVVSSASIDKITFSVSHPHVVITGLKVDVSPNMTSSSSPNISNDLKLSSSDSHNRTSLEVDDSNNLSSESTTFEEDDEDDEKSKVQESLDSISAWLEEILAGLSVVFIDSRVSVFYNFDKDGDEIEIVCMTLDHATISLPKNSTAEDSGSIQQGIPSPKILDKISIDVKSAKLFMSLIDDDKQLKFDKSMVACLDLSPKIMFSLKGASTIEMDSFEFRLSPGMIRTLRMLNEFVSDQLLGNKNNNNQTLESSDGSNNTALDASSATPRTSDKSITIRVKKMQGQMLYQDSIMIEEWEEEKKWTSLPGKQFLPYGLSRWNKSIERLVIRSDDIEIIVKDEAKTMTFRRFYLGEISKIGHKDIIRFGIKDTSIFSDSPLHHISIDFRNENLNVTLAKMFVSFEVEFFLRINEMAKQCLAPFTKISQAIANANDDVNETQKISNQIQHKPTNLSISVKSEKIRICILLPDVTEEHNGKLFVVDLINIDILQYFSISKIGNLQPHFWAPAYGYDWVKNYSRLMWESIEVYFIDNTDMITETTQNHLLERAATPTPDEKENQNIYENITGTIKNGISIMFIGRLIDSSGLFLYPRIDVVVCSELVSDESRISAAKNAEKNSRLISSIARVVEEDTTNTELSANDLTYFQVPHHHFTQKILASTSASVLNHISLSVPSVDLNISAHVLNKIILAIEKNLLLLKVKDNKEQEIPEAKSINDDFDDVSYDIDTSKTLIFDSMIDISIKSGNIHIYESKNEQSDAEVMSAENEMIEINFMGMDIYQMSMSKTESKHDKLAIVNVYDFGLIRKNQHIIIDSGFQDNKTRDKNVIPMIQLTIDSRKMILDSADVIYRLTISNMSFDLGNKNLICINKITEFIDSISFSNFENKEQMIAQEEPITKCLSICFENSAIELGSNQSSNDTNPFHAVLSVGKLTLIPTFFTQSPLFSLKLETENWQLLLNNILPIRNSDCYRCGYFIKRVKKSKQFVDYLREEEKYVQVSKLTSSESFIRIDKIDDEKNPKISVELELSIEMTTCIDSALTLLDVVSFIGDNITEQDVKKNDDIGNQKDTKSEPVIEIFSPISSSINIPDTSDIADKAVNNLKRVYNDFLFVPGPVKSKKQNPDPITPLESKFNEIENDKDCTVVEMSLADGAFWKVNEEINLQDNYFSNLANDFNDQNQNEIDDKDWIDVDYEDAKNIDMSSFSNNSSKRKTVLGKAKKIYDGSSQASQQLISWFSDTSGSLGTKNSGKNKKSDSQNFIIDRNPEQHAVSKNMADPKVTWLVLGGIRLFNNHFDYQRPSIRGSYEETEQCQLARLNFGVHNQGKSESIYQHRLVVRQLDFTWKLFDGFDWRKFDSSYPFEKLSSPNEKTDDNQNVEIGEMLNNIDENYLTSKIPEEEHEKNENVSNNMKINNFKWRPRNIEKYFELKITEASLFVGNLNPAIIVSKPQPDVNIGLSLQSVEVLFPNVPKPLLSVRIRKSIQGRISAIKFAADLDTKENLCDLRVHILPYQIHLEQQEIDCLLEMIEIIPPIPGSQASNLQFRYVELSEFSIRITYHPSGFNPLKLTSGDVYEYAKLISLDNAEVIFRRIHAKNCKDPGELFQGIAMKWIDDIKDNQIMKFVSGVNNLKFKSVISVASGVRDLIVIPLEHYNSDRKLARGVRIGADSFFRNVGGGVLMMLAGRAKNYLTAIDFIAPNLSQPNAQIQKQANEQPKNFTEGFSRGASKFATSVHAAGYHMIYVPIEEYQQNGSLKSSMLKAVHAVPIAVVAPAQGAIHLVYDTSLGVAGSIMGSGEQ